MFIVHQLDLYAKSYFLALNDHLKDQFILWTVNGLYFEGKINKRICSGLVLKMNEVNTALTYHAVATAAKQRDMIDSLDQCCLVKAM